VLAASVAEEAAYRGVGMSILWYYLGNPWLAALLCAAAFSLGHSTQGWKSASVIFAMALAFHGLVALTGTLVLAMVVHAIYDFVAGDRIRRDTARYDREAALAMPNEPGLASVDMLGMDREKRLS
jgi:membrane protease YdiL (CAAX protease family)